MSGDDDRDRATSESETIYLELSDNTSQKFYEVTVVGANVTIRYGRIGASGQTASKTYATAAKAQAEATKKINEKLRKGYTRQTKPPTNASPTDEPSTQAAPTTTPPLPDELALQCLGAVDGPHWLDGKTGRGTVALAPTTEGGYTGTRWQVVPLAPNIIALKCLGHLDGPRWLDGRTLTGDVGLAPTTGGGYTGTRWQVVPLAPNVITLKCLGHLDGPRWLAGATGAGSVALAPTAEGDDTGTRWEIHPIARPAAALPTDPVTPVSPAPPQPLDLPAPSLSLLNVSPYAPPRVAREHLRQMQYPLAFNFRENRYCSMQMPLARSLVGLEMVGTFNNLGNSSFTLTLSAQNETAYSLWFRPGEGHMTQQSTGHQARESLPEGLASGQVLQLVVAITAHNDFVLYFNNQPFAYSPPTRLSAPIDKVTLNYDTTGLQLKLFRVLEPRGKAPPRSAKKGAKKAAIAIPSPETTPSPAAPSPFPPEVEMPEFLDNLPSRFEPLRPLIEAHLVSYIQFTATEAQSSGANDPASGWCQDPLDPWQSKIGGHPYLPKGTPYPADRQTGQLMMMLMQINCADLPVVEHLNLPKQGLLQFFVGLDVPMCELSPEQHRVLYFPAVSYDKTDLITDFSFLEESARALEWYEDVYTLSFAPKRDLFWTARRCLDNTIKIPEALQALSHEFDEWIEEYEDKCIYNAQSQGGRKNKLGGYPEVHSTVAETIEGARGRLLLELQHEFNCDDNFYFYIEDAALTDENFNSIEFYFLRN